MISLSDVGSMGRLHSMLILAMAGQNCWAFIDDVKTALNSAKGYLGITCNLDHVPKECPTKDPDPPNPPFFSSGSASSFTMNYLFIAEY